MSSRGPRARGVRTSAKGHECRHQATTSRSGYCPASTPGRTEAFASGGLQQAHCAHVAVAITKQQQKGNRAPHVHADRVSDGYNEIERKAEFQQRQPAALTAVFLSLPRFVVRFLHAILWGAHKI